MGKEIFVEVDKKKKGKKEILVFLGSNGELEEVEENNEINET